jgi:hypothetical protein
VAEAGAGLELLRKPERRTHLVGDGSTDLLHALLVDLDDPAQQLDPLLARRERERLERTPRCGDGLVDIGFGAKRNLVQRFLARRIDDGQSLFRNGVHPRSVDVEFQPIDHDCDLCALSSRGSSPGSIHQLVSAFIARWIPATSAGMTTAAR